MSIITAVRKGPKAVMATDSLLTFGHRQVPASNIRAKKIRRLGGALVGIAGWSVYEDILEHFFHRQHEVRLDSRMAIFNSFLELFHQLHERYPFVKDQRDHTDSPFVDLDSSFLIVNGEGIFLVTSDLGVTEFQEFYAIGSGAEFAIGALHTAYPAHDDPAAIARLAAEVACEYDVHCGGDIDVQELPLGAANPLPR